MIEDQVGVFHQASGDEAKRHRSASLATAEEEEAVLVPVDQTVIGMGVDEVDGDLFTSYSTRVSFPKLAHEHLVCLRTDWNCKMTPRHQDQRCSEK